MMEAEELETEVMDLKSDETDAKVLEPDTQVTEIDKGSTEVETDISTIERDEKADEMEVGTKPIGSDIMEVDTKSIEPDVIEADTKSFEPDAMEADTKPIEPDVTKADTKSTESDIITSKLDTKAIQMDIKSTDTVISKMDSKSIEMGSTITEIRKDTESTKEGILGVYSAIPEWTEGYISNTIRLPRKREEVETTGKALPLEREEFKRRMNVIKKRKQELVEKAKIIDKRIIEFEKFLQQDRAKLTEEAEKAEKERVKKQEEIAKQKEQIDILKKVLTDLEKQIRHCQVFQDFVQRVADTSDEFSDASNVVDQYEILVSLKAELVEKETLFQEEMERERVHMLQYYEEKHNEILRQKNELAALQISVTQAQNERLIWESKWNHTKNTMSGKSLERAEINTSIRNLSSMISEYQEFLLHNEDVKEEPEKITMALLSEKSNENLLDDEIIEQLQRIKEFILDWTAVVEEVKKSDQFSSTKVQHTS